MSNFVKIIPEPSAIRDIMFKVIRSNIESAITPPRIGRLRSNLVHIFVTSQAIHYKCWRSKVKVTALSNESAAKRQLIGSATSNLVWRRN